MALMRAISLGSGFFNGKDGSVGMKKNSGFLRGPVQTHGFPGVAPGRIQGRVEPAESY
jgi:hypothetical protein